LFVPESVMEQEDCEMSSDTVQDEGEDEGQDEGDPEESETEFLGDMPRVNLMARWGVLSGKEALPGLQTKLENSRHVALHQCFT
jgi:hypothetical protein